MQDAHDGILCEITLLECSYDVCDDELLSRMKDEKTKNVLIPELVQHCSWEKLGLSCLSALLAKALIVPELGLREPLKLRYTNEAREQ